MGFCDEQLRRIRPLWDRMLDHPFLLETRDGRIERDVFATWMRQDYLFVEAAIPFISALLAKAPREHWEPLARVVTALMKELALFEERAGAVDIEIAGTRPAFVNHAYIQFLMATAHGASFAEGYAVLYAAEKAYFDSWRVVAAGLPADSPWVPFVDNWAGPAFAEYVDYLEAQLDLLAADAGDAERGRMAELFELTARYELAFWDMAHSGAGWPGLPEWSDRGGSGAGSGGTGGEEGEQ